jgi:hypothetical protein
MARIPEAEIEHLKRGIPPAKLAEAHGVKLCRHGTDLLGRCPFHADNAPSLVIAPEKNLCHCRGACQTGGSVIDWMMRLDGVSFRHAVEKLRADFPSFAAGSPSPLASPSPPPKLAPLVTPEAGDDDLLASVVSPDETTRRDKPGAAGVSGRSQDRSCRGPPHLPSRFLQPHAGLPDARGRVFPGPRGACAASGSRRFPHERPRAPGRLRRVSALRRRRSCGESVREKDRRAAPRWDAVARVFAQAPVAVCGTPRPSSTRPKSSSAKR